MQARLNHDAIARDIVSELPIDRDYPRYVRRMALRVRVARPSPELVTVPGEPERLLPAVWDTLSQALIFTYGQ